MTPQPDRDDKSLGISRRALLAGAGLGVAAASLGWIPGERILMSRIPFVSYQDTIIYSDRCMRLQLENENQSGILHSSALVH